MSADTASFHLTLDDHTSAPPTFVVMKFINQSGSTTSGSASSDAMAPSSWRPPWFDTTTADAPCSQARSASSAVTSPFTTTGTFQRSRSSVT